VSTLPELVAAQTARAPDAVAVCCGQSRLTYRELGERADALARRLRAHGAGPDRLVAVCLRRTIDLPVVLLAVLKAGAAYLPLDPSQPQARLRALLDDARPVAVLGNDRSVDLGVRTLYSDDPGEDPPALPPPALPPPAR
jgi:non-ribosomal peptide synthetase component F